MSALALLCVLDFLPNQEPQHPYLVTALLYHELIMTSHSDNIIVIVPHTYSIDLFIEITLYRCLAGKCNGGSPLRMQETSHIHVPHMIHEGGPTNKTQIN